MTQGRCDQRVRVFVEVRGGQDDWQEAEDRFTRHGWPVRTHSPAGQGPLGAGVEPGPDARVYEIEVRLFGVARGSDLGAAERVRKVARAARLEAYVLRAEHLHRDRETRSRWRVIDARRRRAALRSPWCRHVAGWSLARGSYDAGGIVTGTVVFAAHAVRASWWFWGILACAGFAGAARTGWRLFPDGRKVGALLVLAVASGAAVDVGRVGRLGRTSRGARVVGCGPAPPPLLRGTRRPHQRHPAHPRLRRFAGRRGRVRPRLGGQGGGTHQGRGRGRYEATAVLWRPYLLIGVAGGTVVLWDQATQEPVKFPANKAWLAPADGGGGSCG
ncbi:hypothetical protein ACWC5C_31925 [Streptomyces sp. NPDC001700]